MVFYVYDISIQELTVHVTSLLLVISMETVYSMTRNREGALRERAIVVGIVVRSFVVISNKSLVITFIGPGSESRDK